MTAKRKKTAPASFKSEMRSIDSLTAREGNPRHHPKEQIVDIAASIQAWGFTIPILIDSAGGIIAGHGRVLAAKRLGILEVPCVIADGWTEAQKRAYVIADNKISENSEWDEDLLRTELRALEASNFELELLGFTSDELAELLPEASALDDESESAGETVTSERCPTCGRLKVQTKL